MVGGAVVGPGIAAESEVVGPGMAVGEGTVVGPGTEELGRSEIRQDHFFSVPTCK